MTISPLAEQWLERRAISLDVAVAMGIYTGKRAPDGVDGEVVPDPGGDIIAFPFKEQGEEVATKYRGRPRSDGSKVFWQRKGGRKTFFNADVLDDPALANGDALVIVEGEPDCLAVLTAGHPFVVSVPDGAPADRDAKGNKLAPVPETAEGIDPNDDEKFAYIASNWERLRHVRRFVIFTDDDGPGRRLRDELVRRLGRVRCSFVRYPDLGGKKPDANEVLLQHGAGAILDMIASASPFPIKGIFTLSDFPEQERPKTISTGWGRLDLPASAGMCSVMLATGMFMVVIGKPGSGKSTWTLQLVANIAKAQGWTIGLASFEVLPVPFVRDILRTHHTGCGRKHWRPEQRRLADVWINDHFVFFHVDPRTDESEQTVEWLIEKAEEAVIRHGIKALVVDPWNEFEHARGSGETETQYTARVIKRLKRFAQTFDVLVIVVIHPTKNGGAKPAEDIGLYDADGSAHWANKADIGIAIEREDGAGGEQGIVRVHGRKFRFSDLGQRGTTEFSFDRGAEIISQ